MENVISAGRLTRAIEMDIGGIDNPDFATTVEAMLHAHPEIRMHRFCIANRICHRIRDLNWHGRCLLDHPNVPLSLWALVLEKANEKPSTIYEFLKGPALAARDNRIQGA